MIRKTTSGAIIETSPWTASKYRIMTCRVLSADMPHPRSGATMSSPVLREAPGGSLFTHSDSRQVTERAPGFSARAPREERWPDRGSGREMRLGALPKADPRRAAQVSPDRPDQIRVTQVVLQVAHRAR